MRVIFVARATGRRAAVPAERWRVLARFYALDARLTDPALRGTPVKLSIDTRVQGALEAELGRAMATTSAIGAAGVA